MAADLTTVFLDRDGVINRKLPDGRYVSRWSEFEFLPGAAEGMRLLKEANVRVIVATNQRGVARRLTDERELADMHRRMLDELQNRGGRCDAIYVCPHEIGTCRCRKPEIGMFLDARREFPDIDFASSAVVGDSVSDMEAGSRLGCLTYLVADPAKQAEVASAAAARGAVITGVAGSLLEIVERHLARHLIPD